MCGGIGELIIAKPRNLYKQLIQACFRVIHTLLARTSHSHRSQELEAAYRLQDTLAFIIHHLSSVVVREI